MTCRDRNSSRPTTRHAPRLTPHTHPSSARRAVHLGAVAGLALSVGLCLTPGPAAAMAEAVGALEWSQDARAGGPIEMPGAIDAVTVFRGQALVTRMIPAGSATGLREFVVTNLPEMVVPASLYAEGGAGVEIRSVSYRIRPVAADTRDSVRQIEEQLRAAQDLVEASRANQRYLDWKRQYLDNLEKYVTGTAVVENARGVLNAETLTRLTEYLAEARRQHTEDGLKLAQALRGQEERVTLLQRELATMTSKTSRTVREALIFANVTQPDADFRLTYLVERASWAPSYTLQRDSGGVTVEYQAQIQQMSGEDWNGVRMTLSTATPTLLASGPVMEPLTLALSPRTPESPGVSGQAWLGAKAEIESAQRLAAANRGNFAQQPRRDGITQGELYASITAESDRELNDLAMKNQILDVTTSERVERRAERHIFKPDESVSVTYALRERTSLPSRADQQLVLIGRDEFPAEFAKVASPLLSQYVYNEATIQNNGSNVLLAGPVASYLHSEFVGRGTIPTVASGQTFTGGFGIDSSLRTSRELVERTETTQGGNRVVEFTYRLAIENFADTPAGVRLLDRIPSSRNADIRVTLLAPGRELSTDPVYQKNDRRNGILRWDVTVPPGAKGNEAFTLEYKFRLEYDRQMGITEAR